MTSNPNLYAVIPTCSRTRLPWLAEMCWRLLQDGVPTVVVDNGCEPPLEMINGRTEIIHYRRPEGEPVNLSKIWNIGLDRVAAAEQDNGEEYVVAVFNDDLTLPKNIVQALAAAIMANDAAASFVAPHGIIPKRVDTDPWHLGNRMVGYAFALRGSAGLRADEDFLWWWGDSDLDLRARQAGGVVGIEAPDLTHHDPNGFTNRNPGLYEQAGKDRETFLRKHGFLPW